MSSHRFLEILLVDDDLANVHLMREILKEGKVPLNLSVVGDGVQALGYLRREGSYEKAIRPDLILLDLNLPRMGGRELLDQIKKDDRLKTIPVVILSTSDEEIDVLKTYDLGCNCYITKPLGLEQFTRVLRSIESFWFTLVRLPTP